MRAPQRNGQVVVAIIFLQNIPLLLEVNRFTFFCVKLALASFQILQLEETIMIVGEKLTDITYMNEKQLEAEGWADFGSRHAPICLFLKPPTFFRRKTPKATGLEPLLSNFLGINTSTQLMLMISKR